MGAQPKQYGLAMPHCVEGTVMAWPVANDAFEDVDFLDGTGWLECAGIHRAIKERAECVGSSLASTTYADDFSGDVWTGDPAGDHTYLRDLFEQWYTDIETLVDNSPAIKWTTESAGVTEWTMATLETSIGMGTFADLLTDSPWPTDPRPFIWLQECLDRLIYARRFKSLVTNASFDDRLRGTTYPDLTSAQAAWTDALGDTDPEILPIADGDAVLWGRVTGNPSFPQHYNALIQNELHSANIITGATLTGTQTAAEWELRPYTVSDCTLTQIDVSIDGADPVPVSLEDTTFVRVTSTDIPIAGARSDISMTFTNLPGTVPFDGVSFSYTNTGSLGVQLYAAWVHFDIAGELTDQEP